MLADVPVQAESGERLTLVFEGGCSRAYPFTKWRATRLHWAWFVALSLLGGVAFAVPVSLLWRRGAAD